MHGIDKGVRRQKSVHRACLAGWCVPRKLYTGSTSNHEKEKRAPLSKKVGDQSKNPDFNATKASHNMKDRLGLAKGLGVGRMEARLQGKR